MAKVHHPRGAKDSIYQTEIETKRQKESLGEAMTFDSSVIVVATLILIVIYFCFTNGRVSWKKDEENRSTED